MASLSSLSARSNSLFFATKYEEVLVQKRAHSSRRGLLFGSFNALLLTLTFRSSIFSCSFCRSSLRADTVRSRISSSVFGQWKQRRMYNHVRMTHTGTFHLGMHIPFTRSREQKIFCRLILAFEGDCSWWRVSRLDKKGYERKRGMSWWSEDRQGVYNLVPPSEARYLLDAPCIREDYDSDTPTRHSTDNKKQALDKEIQRNGARCLPPR